MTTGVGVGVAFFTVVTLPVIGSTVDVTPVAFSLITLAVLVAFSNAANCADVLPVAPTFTV